MKQFITNLTQEKEGICMQDDERRRHHRIHVPLEVELTHESTGTVNLKTRDLSDGGVFLVMKNQPIPPEGSLVTVRLKGAFDGGELPPATTMKVVRLEGLGVGLEFVDK